jgi:hypothetical protein
MIRTAGYGFKLQLFSAENHSICSPNDLFYFTAENHSIGSPNDLFYWPCYLFMGITSWFKRPFDFVFESEKE